MMKKLILVFSLLLSSTLLWASSSDWMLLTGKVKSFNRNVVILRTASGNIRVLRPSIQNNKLKTGLKVTARVHKAEYALLNEVH